MYEADLNLQCGVKGYLPWSAVCRRSLPCVGVANRGISGDQVLARIWLLMPLETISAKEDRRRKVCGGKHLGCPKGAKIGLQCGLSGSRVVPLATRYCDTEGETA